MIERHAMTIPVSHEMIYGPDLSDEQGHLEPPTPEELAEYRAWRKKFTPLYKKGVKRGWWRDGGPDYGPEYTKPEGRWVSDEPTTRFLADAARQAGAE